MVIVVHDVEGVGTGLALVINAHDMIVVMHVSGFWDRDALWVR
jgi:hypothetical protein